MKFLQLSLLCILVYFVSALPKDSAESNVYGMLDGDNEDTQNDDDYLDESENPEEPVENEAPNSEGRILSKPEVFHVGEGQDVVLPCNLENKDSGVTIWYHNAKILFQAGASMMDKTVTHIKRMDDNSLHLSKVSSADSGSYTCKLLLTQNKQPSIKHTVQVHKPPKIKSFMPKNNKSEYNEGDSLELKCVVESEGSYKVSFHKGSERIPLEGNELRITDMRRSSAGVYRCLADSEYGADHAHVTININHAPTVKLEKIVVTSESNMNTELKCTVHAFPQANVNWLKDGQNIIQAKPHIEFKRNHNDHILLIKDLEETDFGKYTCFAKNNLGSQSRELNLVKTPAILGFIKSHHENKELVLKWTVESKSPISEHELQFRMKGESTWHNIIPEVSNERDIYTLKYSLKDLEPGTYETRARSRNTHGWSEYSDPAVFEGVKLSAHKHHGKKGHKEHKDKHSKEAPVVPPEPELPKETAVGASQTGGASSIRSSMAALVLLLLARL